MIGGKIMLKNISGSKVAFRSISFSVKTGPLNIYAYVLLVASSIDALCSFPGNYIKIIINFIIHVVFVKSVYHTCSQSVSGGRLALNVVFSCGSTAI